MESESQDTRPISASRRNAVTTDNDIDLILARRVKRSSVIVPPVSQIRNTRIKEYIFDETKIANKNEKQYKVKEFQQLLGETNGKKYDNYCGRPEFEIHTIINSKYFSNIEIINHNNNENNIDNEEGKNLENKDLEEIPISTKYYNITTIVTEYTTEEKLNRKIDLLFDPMRSLYILSPKIENLLLLMLKYINQDNSENNVKNELIISKAVCLIGKDDIFQVLDSSKQRVWRRFIRIHLLPHLKNEKKMNFAEEMLKNMSMDDILEVTSEKKLNYEEYKYDSSSDESSKDKNQKNKKKKPPTRMRK